MWRNGSAESDVRVALREMVTGTQAATDGRLTGSETRKAVKATYPRNAGRLPFVRRLSPYGLATSGRFACCPRHGGDCTAALTLAMDREAMEAEETASNDRPMTQAPERDKRISALARRTRAILLATPEYRLDDILSHKAGMPRRQAQRTDLR